MSERSAPAPTTRPAQVWADLLAGNERAASGRVEAKVLDAAQREQLLTGQSPRAVVLGCSDSRYAPEHLFDAGPGQLFVVRTAGHVLDAATLGSVEFGVSELGADLVVVLGHRSCGAVRATMARLDGGPAPAGWVSTLVDGVLQVAAAARADGQDDPEEVGAAHVRQTAGRVLEVSRVLAEAVAAGRCAVVAATASIADWRVHELGRHGPALGPAHAAR